MTEKLFKLYEIPNDSRVRNNLYPSLLFPPNAVIRAGDLQLRVESTNDKKATVTLAIVGVFLQPKDEDATSN